MKVLRCASARKRSTATSTPKKVWLPRKRDITAVSDHELKMICDRLNATPRKCLGWQTPAEVFREKMMEEMGQRTYDTADRIGLRISNFRDDAYEP